MKSRITLTLNVDERTQLNALTRSIMESTGVELTPQNVFVTCFKKGLKELSAVHNVRSKMATEYKPRRAKGGTSPAKT